MAFVSKRDDVIYNIKKLEGFLSSGKAEEKDFALDGVLNSEIVVIYKVNGINHFGPCRFFAFKKNTIKDDLESRETIEDKEIANVMTKIVGAPFTNGMTENKYKEYVESLGQEFVNIERKFWRVKDERGKNLDLKL